mgnify:CR=1 FL=1
MARSKTGSRHWFETQPSAKVLEALQIQCVPAQFKSIANLALVLRQKTPNYNKNKRYCDQKSYFKRWAEIWTKPPETHSISKAQYITSQLWWLSKKWCSQWSVKCPFLPGSFRAIEEKLALLLQSKTWAAQDNISIDSNIIFAQKRKEERNPKFSRKLERHLPCIFKWTSIVLRKWEWFQWATKVQERLSRQSSLPRLHHKVCRIRLSCWKCIAELDRFQTIGLLIPRRLQIVPWR